MIKNNNNKKENNNNNNKNKKGNNKKNENCNSEELSNVNNGKNNGIEINNNKHISNNINQNNNTGNHSSIINYKGQTKDINHKLILFELIEKKDGKIQLDIKDELLGNYFVFNSKKMILDSYLLCSMSENSLIKITDDLKLIKLLPVKNPFFKIKPKK